MQHFLQRQHWKLADLLMFLYTVQGCIAHDENKEPRKNKFVFYGAENLAAREA